MRAFGWESRLAISFTYTLSVVRDGLRRETSVDPPKFFNALQQPNERWNAKTIALIVR